MCSVAFDQGSKHFARFKFGVLSVLKEANSVFISMQETVQVRDAADGPDLHRRPAGPPTAQKLILGNRIRLLIFCRFCCTKCLLDFPTFWKPESLPRPYVIVIRTNVTVPTQKNRSLQNYLLLSNIFFFWRDLKKISDGRKTRNIPPTKKPRETKCNQSKKKLQDKHV